MKTSTIASLVAVAALLSPVAANAGESTAGSHSGHAVSHHQRTFAKATALYAPERREAAPRTDRPASDGPEGIMRDGDAGFSWEPNNW